MYWMPRFVDPFISTPTVVIESELDVDAKVQVLSSGFGSVAYAFSFAGSAQRVPVPSAGRITPQKSKTAYRAFSWSVLSLSKYYWPFEVSKFARLYHWLLNQYWQAAPSSFSGLSNSSPENL